MVAGVAAVAAICWPGSISGICGLGGVFNTGIVCGTGTELVIGVVSGCGTAGYEMLSLSSLRCDH